MFCPVSGVKTVVLTVYLVQHRWEDTGRKKGFGYMEFAEYEGAQAAIGIHTVTGKDLEVKPYTQVSQGGVLVLAASTSLLSLLIALSTSLLLYSIRYHSVG